MSKQPLISIITPTYNLIKGGRKDYIIQNIESVHNQTYENIEHIIIDGASNDGTLDLLKPYEEKGWIKIYSEPDKGIYDAMNKGLKRANGEYILFLNSDDYFINMNAIKDSISKLQATKSDFSYGACNFVKNKQSLGKFISCLSCFPVHMPICHNTLFVKTDVMKKLNCFDTKFKSAADYDFLIRMILSGYQGCEIKDTMINYDLGGTSSNEELNRNETTNVFFKNFSPLMPNLTMEDCFEIFDKKLISIELYNHIKTKVCNSLKIDMNEKNNKIIDNKLYIDKRPYLISPEEANKKKKVLVLFHMNFLEKDRGCFMYIYEIVKKFKEKGYLIDFFTTDIIQQDYSNFSELNNKEENLINNFYFIKDTHEKKQHIYADFSWVSDNVLDEFNKIVTENNYDIINIHYLQWMDLIKYGNISNNTKIIYSMHDSNLVQCYLNNGINSIPNALAQEIELISYADEVACISNDEKVFFEKLVEDSKFYFLPHPLPQKELPNVNKDIDVLFLAADNPYNLEGILWFINSVVHFLNTNVKITISGRVWLLLDQQPEEIKNKIKQYKINRIDFALNLDDLYARTKLSIVTMFHGTGMKIKTIDSISRGIPVVANELGVDGLQDKNESGCLVTNNPVEFAELITKLLEDNEFYTQTVEKQKNYFKKYLSLEYCNNVIDTMLSDINKCKPIKFSNCETSPESQNEFRNKTNKQIKLFGFLTIFKFNRDNKNKKWYLFGLPIFRIKQKNKHEKKYYIFAIPVLKIVEKG